MDIKFLKSVCTVSMAAILLASCGSDISKDLQSGQQQESERVAEKSNANASKASPEVQTLIDIARAGTHGYDITRDLTTEIGPRLAGSEAEARARRWTVEKFKEIGLQNVRVEPFTIKGWERGVETARIVSPYPQSLYITALGGSVATPEEGITAELAYFPTYEDLIAAPEGSLEGKIAYISGRMKKAPDGAGYGPANRKRRTGATEAKKRGALAVVIRSVGTDSHRFPHTGQMRYAPDVTPIPIGALSAPDADQLDRIFEAGQSVTLDLTLTPKAVGDLTSGNVIGEIIGSEKPEEIVLISGHLDSWDQGTGALDDGAGIGVSAGAAQVILEAGYRPKRTIRVVAFGAEEVGLLGGFAYVEAHKDELKNHALATESDFGATAPYEVLSGVKSGKDVIEEMARAVGLPMGSSSTNGGPDIGPMFRAGVPAMRFQQDGTDYFDYHHTPDDTFDKVDADDMAVNVAAFATMAWMASEAETNFRDDE